MERNSSGNFNRNEIFPNRFPTTGCTLFLAEARICKGNQILCDHLTYMVGNQFALYSYDPKRLGKVFHHEL